MKMKHLIPALALAMLFATPAFADDDPPSMSTELEFGVPAFFTIHRGTEVVTATAEPNDIYSKLNLTANLKANYIVYTNNGTDNEKVKITATCPHSGSGVISAFSGTTADAYYLVFGNETRTPDATSIAAAKSPAADSAGSDNPNAITLKVTPVCLRKANSAYGVAEDTAQSGVFSGNGIQYTLANGKYDFTFTCAKEAETNTFSTADTLGDYQATITITQGTL